MIRGLQILFLPLLFLTTSAISITPREGIAFNKVDAQRAVAIILAAKNTYKIVPLIRDVYDLSNAAGSENLTRLKAPTLTNPATGMNTIASITASERACAGKESKYNFDKQVARDAFYTIIDKIDHGLTTASSETVVHAGCHVYELTTGPAGVVNAMLKEPAMYGKSSAEDIAKDFRCDKWEGENNVCRCWFEKAREIFVGYHMGTFPDCQSYTLEHVLPDPTKRAGLNFLWD